MLDELKPHAWHIKSKKAFSFAERFNPTINWLSIESIQSISGIYASNEWNDSIELVKQHRKQKQEQKKNSHEKYHDRKINIYIVIPTIEHGLNLNITKKLSRLTGLSFMIVTAICICWLCVTSRHSRSPFIESIVFNSSNQVSLRRPSIISN